MALNIKGDQSALLATLERGVFCQNKVMTTGGEGGMVTTNDHELWSRMWSYKDHGKVGKLSTSESTYQVFGGYMIPLAPIFA